MDNIDLKDIKKIIIDNKYVFLMIILIAAVIGVACTIFTKPLYESTEKIQVDKTETSLTEFIKNDEIFEDTAKALGIESKEIKKNSELVYTSATRTISVTVQNENSSNAKIITSKLSNVLKNKIRETYGITSKTIQSATENNKPTNRNFKKNVLFVVTSIVFISGIYILTILLKKSKLVNKTENLDDMYTILGQFPYRENVDEAIILQDSNNNDLLKKMLTNVSLNKNVSNVKTLLITSTMKGEGKSYVASNIAYGYAKLGKKVLLVDTDIKDGKLNEIFDIKNEKGFSNLLIESAKDNTDKSILENLIYKTKFENLYLMISGEEKNTDSYKLLMNGNLNNFITILKTMFDIVVFDGVSAIDSNDSIIVSNSCDATIIVTEYDKTKIEDIGKVEKNIEKVGGKILGIIINKTPQISEKHCFRDKCKNIINKK